MTTTLKSKPRQAEILREYGPYPGMDHIHGVTFDGAHVWFARGESIVALDPESGTLVRELAVAADAGTAFDGEFLWQLADDRIQKVDPRSGQVVATIPAPSTAATRASLGPRERSGLENTAPARSTRSTPRPAPSCARLNRIASSPASPGSTASSGTPPWRPSRASSAALIRRQAKSSSDSRCPPVSP